MDFFFPPSPFFVVTDISPHFPGIKNPFWIIHSVLNLAATCIHNKLNLLRRFWDLWWTCRWQTTRILSFIFNTKPSRSSPHPLAPDAAFVFHLHGCFSSLKCGYCYEYWKCSPCHISCEIRGRAFFLCIFSERHSDPARTKKRETTPVESHQNRERSATHFLMVTQAMRPGNWTVGGSLCVLPPDMPRIPLKESFYRRQKYAWLLLPSLFQLLLPNWNHHFFSFFAESNYFPFQSRDLCLQLSVRRTV